MPADHTGDRTRVVCDLPHHLLDALKRESAERNVPMAGMLSLLVWQMAVERKKRERDGLLTAHFGHEIGGDDA